MKEMNREDKILEGSKILAEYRQQPEFDATDIMVKIFDATNPSEIKPGTWGKFWDVDPVSDAFIYGKLFNILTSDEDLLIYVTGECSEYYNFLPMTLDEITADIKTQMEKKSE